MIRRFAVALLILLFVVSCKQKPVIHEESVAAKPVENKVAPPPNPVIAESNDLFRAGIEALARGDRQEALNRFDLALTTVLDCAGDENLSPPLRHHFEDLVARIHEAEIHQSQVYNPGPVYDDASLSKLLDDALVEEDAEIEAVRNTPSATENSVPLVENAIVDRFMERFTTVRADVIGGGLERSTRYMPMIRRIFAEEGLPMELCYLPLIESAYKVKARSHAKAVGLWQFVAGTGKLYGLKIDWWEDQRRNPELATRAAARYLKDLHERFGDWYLALSAYNAGPGRVSRAIRRGGTRDFWQLYRRRLLPRETRGYVPAFIAAVKIARNPESFGFSNLDYEPPMNTQPITIDFALEMEVLAEHLDMDKEQLLADNPGLLRDMAPGNRPVVIQVPDSRKAADALARIPEEQRVRTKRHRVRSGDTVSKIAARYGSTVQAIMATNRIRNPRRLKIGQILLIPRNGAPVKPLKVEEVGEVKMLTHTVRRGDSLYQLAKRYQTTIPSLLALNPEIDPVAMIPGQKIQVQTGDRNGGTVTPSRGKGFTLYKVKRGDTIYKIARRYGIQTQHLFNYNQMKSNSVIYPGQRLKLPNTHSLQPSVVVYKVRPGDTLSQIAQRFKIRLGKLMEWNHLTSKHKLSVGQELLIYR